MDQVTEAGKFFGLVYNYHAGIQIHNARVFVPYESDETHMIRSFKNENRYPEVFINLFCAV